MLSSSYAAIEQFQSQKYSINSIKSLKDLLDRLDLSLSIQLTSSSVWILDWDFSGKKLGGTLEIGIQTKLIRGSDTFEARRPLSLRLEEPVPIGVNVLEFRFLELLKESFDSILWAPYPRTPKNGRI